MNKRFLIGFAGLALLASCGSNKSVNSGNDSIAEETAVANAEVNGQWVIKSINLNDSVKILTADVTPDSKQTITFEEDSYFIQTNCNTISGGYSIKGDSITLGDGIMTEMACDNMAVEDALRSILHNIVTVNFENDSTARLNTNQPGVYMELSKASGL